MIQWLTTSPNPNVRGYGADDGQRGWKLHAVEGDDTETLNAFRYRRAACGLKPAHGWGLDLFIEEKCIKCLVKTGLACPACKGTGYAPGKEYKTCLECFGKRERKIG